MINPQVVYDSFQNRRSMAKQHCVRSQFKEAQNIADDFFKRNCIHQAISIYQIIIESNINFDYQIDGLGNHEEHNGYYEWYISQWYFLNKTNKTIKGSPYDALSLCYSFKTINEKGQMWYQDMLTKYPNNYQLLFGYANVLYNKKYYEESFKIYQQVINLKPNFTKSYTSIAFIYQYQRIQKSKSIKWANKALQIDAKNQFALFIKARNQKNVQIKLQKLKQVSMLYPMNTRIINQIGIVYGGVKKDYDQAIFWYSKCVQLNPHYCSAHNNIGVNYELKMNYDQAKKWYYKAIELDRQYKAAHKNLTDVYDTLLTSEQAILEQSKLYKIEQDWFCYEIGLSYYDKKQIDKSIAWYLRAVSKNNQNHKFFNSLAIAYDEKKQYDKAIQNYKKCIEIDPSYFSAYYNIAITYKNTNKVEQAIEWYVKCIQINPKHSYTYNNLGNIYKNKGEYQQAIKYYLKAIEYLSTYTLALTNLGICYENTKKYRQAINCYQRAEQLLPNDNNSLSKSNRQFIQAQIKKFKNQTMQWKNKGIMSPNINDIKNSMVFQFETKISQLFSDKNRTNQKISTTDNTIQTKSNNSIDMSTKGMKFIDTIKL